MRTLVAIVCSTIAAILGACGGKVVVDVSGGGEGGAGAAATSSSAGPTTSGTTNNSGTGGCFFVPTPVGAVDPNTCGGTSTTGNGGPPECTQQCNDQDNHVWEVTCQDQSCRCVYDNKTICTCAIEGNATLCGGGAKGCCPTPWLSP